MKLVTYKSSHGNRSGVLLDGMVIDLSEAADSIGQELPTTVLELLQMGNAGMDRVRNVLESVAENPGPFVIHDPVLVAPVPNPPSVRDGYAFRQHVETARRNRGVAMIPEFDEIPIFYFTNHNAIFGPGQVPVMDDHLDKLDFELECAAIIGKGGRNIPASQADEHIAGFTIMNDLSARGLQMKEMKMNLGPAKGKDFGTVIGPFLVMRDELEDKRIAGDDGERYDLAMTATVNGIQVSSDNLSNMNWTFAQIIERASYGVDLYPGDVIGSGTCGTGCFMELNGSKITDNQWLGDGDNITLAIEGMGELSTIIKHVGR